MPGGGGTPKKVGEMNRTRSSPRKLRVPAQLDKAFCHFLHGGSGGRSLAAPAQPRERLDWCGVCRGVREPTEKRQTVDGCLDGVSEENQASRDAQMA
jgi:hypothetical protein